MQRGQSIVPSSPRVIGLRLASAGRSPRRRVSGSACSRFVLALLLVLVGSTQALCQRDRAPLYGVPSSPKDTVDTMIPMVDGTGRPDPKMLKMLNAVRQSSMVSDTAKLLKLAQELNAEIGAANGAPLTAVQLKKVAKIEKLAHNIKTEMSNSVPPGLQDQLPFPAIDR